MAEVSTRYGVALFDLVMETGSLNACLEQAIMVRNTLIKPEFRQVMAHPHISAEEKLALLQDVFPGTLNDQLMGFVSLLITKNRAEALAPALAEFISLGHRAQGRIDALVVSAAQLDDMQILEIRRLLSRKLGKEATLSLEVDPALIGGFSIYVDGHCVDGTVKRRLQDMRDSIVKGGGPQ